MVNGSDIKSMEEGDAHLEGTQDRPYSKVSFLKTINRNTEYKSRGLYTFSGYTENFYEQGKKSYINVAQKNMTGSFVALGSGMSTPTDTAVIEISKREKDGKIPDSIDLSNKLTPTMMLSYKGHTITIPLENSTFQENQWFDVLDKVYEDINQYLKKYETIGEKEGAEIHDFVIQTLKEKKYLKAPLEKSIPSIQGLKDRLSNLFGLGNKKIEQKKPKKEAEKVETESPELIS